LNNSLTPAEQYSRDITAGKILPDGAQEIAISALNSVHQHLVSYWDKPKSLLGTFLGNERQGLKDISGLYMWGGVGRGKTFLMDIFYQCLPGERKLRMHFHRFMQMVHRSLYANRGSKNPLELVAQEIAEKADVICFDEFFVSDIGDAMILGNLLDALFSKGMVLVATSNIVPEKLYERGLQRQRFLPAIALLEKHSRVLNVDGGTDYRLRTLEDAGIYHTPLGKEAEKAMSACFQTLARGMATDENQALEILGRDIMCRLLVEGMAWFEFTDLCDGPRSAADYIEISTLFHTVLVSSVPVFNEHNDDQARRFISMVDEFYDQNVKLILSAECKIEDLYQGQELLFPFERTSSRLLEMQSHEYLGLEHRPDL
jgi:cell division protein ZapE